MCVPRYYSIYRRVVMTVNLPAVEAREAALIRVCEKKIHLRLLELNNIVSHFTTSFGWCDNFVACEKRLTLKLRRRRVGFTMANSLSGAFSILSHDARDKTTKTLNFPRNCSQHKSCCSRASLNSENHYHNNRK